MSGGGQNALHMPTIPATPVPVKTQLPTLLVIARVHIYRAPRPPTCGQPPFLGEFESRSERRGLIPDDPLVSDPTSLQCLYQSALHKHLRENLGIDDDDKSRLLSQLGLKTHDATYKYYF
jgi:hypothetical protein